MQDIKQDYVEPVMEIIHVEYVFTLTQSTDNNQAEEFGEMFGNVW